MIIVRTFVLCVCICGTALALAGMTYDQYGNELSAAQLKEKTAKEQIAQEQGLIEALKQQVADVDQRVSSTREEIFQIIGKNEQDVANARQELAMLQSDIRTLALLPSQDLAKRKNDMYILQGRMAAIKRNTATFLSDVASMVYETESLLESVASQVSAPIPSAFSGAPSSTATAGQKRLPTRFVAGTSDCLFRIAGYDSIYNDPNQWIRIYEANKSLIDGVFTRLKNSPNLRVEHPEDLILPGQVLVIPR
jgi:nucleoid-associated protein YgaU